MGIKAALKRCAWILPDRGYVFLNYIRNLHRIPNLRNPKTFNEKLQWLKLHDRRPVYTTMADKVESRAFIEERAGAGLTVPLLGVWDSFDDIDFARLPDRFVIKCSHDSGGLVVCADKSHLDMDGVRKRITKSLESNYYFQNREWPYKDIKPKVFAEEYLEEAPGENLWDYKFFCFGGRPKVMYMCKEHDSPEALREAFFDMEGRFLELEMDAPRPETPPELPPCFGEMERLAAILSEGVPFLRVDFFYVKGRVYAGELTFFHCGGFAPVKPREWDLRLGSWIELPAPAGNPKRSEALVSSGDAAISKPPKGRRL